MTLAEIRRRIAELQNEIRDTDDDLKLYRAATMQQIIAEELGGDEKRAGSNEAIRERWWIVRLGSILELTEREVHRNTLQKELIERQAELEILLDDRRAHEWEIRARLADAILSRFSVVPEHPNDSNTDDAMDGIVDRSTGEIIGGVFADMPF